ncbi:MAG: FHA domain-containing protein [Planctomycetota bacterium]|nr:FHA domain-containing protein [Planctomycetota bacterium]
MIVATGSKQMVVASLSTWAKNFHQFGFEEFVAQITGPFLVLDVESDRPNIVDLGAMFNGQPIVLGRGDMCELPLEETGVSRQHAGLYYDGQDWTITDYKSTNGTFAPRRLAPMQPAVVREHDLIRLGDRLHLKFIHETEMFERIVLWNNDSQAHRRTTKHLVSLNNEMKPRSTRIIRRPTKDQLEMVAEEVQVSPKPAAHRRPVSKSLLQQQKVRPRSMDRFVEETRNMPREDFLRFFPHPFLVLLNAKWGLEANTKMETLVLSNMNRNTRFGEVAFWIVGTEKEGETIYLGRDEENTIVVKQPSVSRVHAEINDFAGQLWIKDLKSTNGTFVDGERLEGERPLGDESLIRFGGDCSLQFMVPEKMWDFTRLFVDYPHLDLS